MQDDPQRGSMIETHPEFRDVIYRVLDAMRETNIPECYLPFSCIAETAGLPTERAAVVARFLGGLGYAAFARGLMTEDGEMRGSGYALTDKGFALLDRVEAIAMEARKGGDGEAGSVRSTTARAEGIAQGDQP